jgi:PadR family transcriptional regulator, regulatory protein PadR
MGDELRMTIPTLRVLAVLLADPGGEHYGLELCEAAGLPSGTVYPILVRLESSGWVEGAWEDIDEQAEGRRRRHYYQLTRTGRQQAQAALTRRERALRPVRLGGLEPGGAST